MKKFLIPLFVSLLFPSLKAQDSVVYTLKQCIDIAVKNNITVKTSESQAQTANALLQQSRASNLPSVSAYINQGMSQGKSINPFTNTFINQQVMTGQYGINGSLLLFGGFSTYNSMRQSAYNYQAGKMDLEQAKTDITMNVMLAYLLVLSNEEQLNQAASQVEVSKAQAERLTVLEKNNAVSPSVLYDTKGQLANDKLSYINAKNTLVTAKNTLFQLMNMNLVSNAKFEKINAPAELKKYGSTSEAVFSVASKDFPLIKAAEYRRMSATKALHSARGQLFPSLSLVGSVGTNYSDAATTQKLIGVSDASTDAYVTVNNSNVPVYAPQYNYSSEKINFNDQFKNNLNSYVGVSLRLSLFNSLQTKTQMSIAKINKHQSENLKQTTSVRLKSSIDQAHSDMTAAYERYEILQEQVGFYSESFKIATSKFEKGAIGTVEYTVSKSNTDRASMNLIAAKYDYILKCKILDYYSGKIPL
ncbi:MAG: TolC family protein [Bacteroidetes bacterium]|jgi:outer membrane protein|nr:TolC family protein [Bacteroidota bacterium]